MNAHTCPAFLRQVKANFWDACESGDIGEAFDRLRLNDADFMGMLKDHFTILAGRSSILGSFSDFLGDELLLKSAFVMLGKADENGEGSVAASLADIAPQWEAFVNVMTTGDAAQWFSKLVHDRVRASWVVLRCAALGCELPRRVWHGEHVWAHASRTSAGFGWGYKAHFVTWVAHRRAGRHLEAPRMVVVLHRCVHHVVGQYGRVSLVFQN